jgi:hypothetical protein
VNERQSVFPNGTLAIRRLTTGDAGRYTCTVEGHQSNHGGKPPSANSEMKLVVRGELWEIVVKVEATLTFNKVLLSIRTLS